MKTSFKKRTNPYLFLLLKHLLAYETNGGIGSQPSAHEIADHIARRNQFDKSFSSQSFRTNFLGTKKFLFTKERLDFVARQITLLGYYNTWEEFFETFKEEMEFVTSEERYMDCDFDELKEDDQQLIEGWAQAKVLYLHNRSLLLDGKRKQKIIKDAGKWVVRTANMGELWSVMSKYILPSKADYKSKGLYTFLKINHEQRERKRISDLYLVNKNIFFILRDYLGIQAILNLIPIKVEVYEGIKQGTIKFNDISDTQIFNEQNRMLVKHIFINVAAFYNVAAFQEMINYLEHILLTLSTSKDIVICTVAKTKHAESLLKSFNFKVIEKVKRFETEIADEIRECLFFETSYYELFKRADILTPDKNLIDEFKTGR